MGVFVVGAIEMPLDGRAIQHDRIKIRADAGCLGRALLEAGRSNAVSRVRCHLFSVGTHQSG